MWESLQTVLSMCIFTKIEHFCSEPLTDYMWVSEPNVAVDGADKGGHGGKIAFDIFILPYSYLPTTSIAVFIFSFGGNYCLGFFLCL